MNSDCQDQVDHSKFTRFKEIVSSTASVHMIYLL